MPPASIKPKRAKRNTDPAMLSPMNLLGKAQFSEALRNDPELRDGPKLLGLRLLDYHNSTTGKCFPSIERLALDRGCDERTIKRQLKLLEKHNWFEIARGIGGLASDYRPRFERVDRCGAPGGWVTSDTSQGDIARQERVTPVSPQPVKEPEKGTNQGSDDILFRDGGFPQVQRGAGPRIWRRWRRAVEHHAEVRALDWNQLIRKLLAYIDEADVDRLCQEAFMQPLPMEFLRKALQDYQANLGSIAPLAAVGHDG